MSEYLVASTVDYGLEISRNTYEIRNHVVRSCAHP